MERLRRLAGLLGAVVLLTAGSAAPSGAEALIGGPCLGFNVCVHVVAANYFFGLDGSGWLTSSQGLNCRYVDDKPDLTTTCDVYIRSLAGSSVQFDWEAVPDAHTETYCFGGLDAWTASCSGGQVFTPDWTLYTPQVDFRLQRFEVDAGVTSTDGATGSVTSNAAIGISCPSTCVNRSVPWGTAATFTATPSTFMLFTGWAGGPCLGSLDPTCSFKVTDFAAVVARFAWSETLAVTVAQLSDGSRLGNGSVTSAALTAPCVPGPSACDAVVADGKAITLTAHPASGSVFKRWEGACTGTATTCTLTMTTDRSTTAYFAPAPIVTPPPTARPTATPAPTVSRSSATPSLAPPVGSTAAPATALPPSGGPSAGLSSAGPTADAGGATAEPSVAASGGPAASALGGPSLAPAAATDGGQPAIPDSILAVAIVVGFALVAIAILVVGLRRPSRRPEPPASADRGGANG